MIMGKVISKRERALRILRANEGVFRCPICQNSLISNQDSGVCCSNKHAFDLARNGYLNLLVGPQNCQYDKALFTARREVFLNGVYDPLVGEVAKLIREAGQKDPLVLDAGCGEGSFLAKLEKQLTGIFLGIDISRDGVRLAAAQDEPVLWCVADLATLPLSDASLDVIVNVLSPANYGEFERVLKPDGILVKVLPGEDYLREIRERLSDKKHYSNQEVLAHLEANVKIRKSSHLYYRVPVNPDLWEAMVAMTPLTRHREVQGDAPAYLTVDLQVIQGILSN